MSLTDNLIKIYLKKITKIPIEIILSDLGYTLIISAKKTNKRRRRESKNIPKIS